MKNPTHIISYGFTVTEKGEIVADTPKIYSDSKLAMNLAMDFLDTLPNENEMYCIEVTASPPILEPY